MKLIHFLKPCGKVYLQGDRDFGQSPQGLELMGVFHMLKQILSLRTSQQVTLSNPEKHAQPSLPEAVDHMVDVLKKFLGKIMVSWNLS